MTGRTKPTRPKASTSGGGQRVSIVTGFSNEPNNFSSKVIRRRWCARVKKVRTSRRMRAACSRRNVQRAISTARDEKGSYRTCVTIDLPMHLTSLHEIIIFE